MAQRQGQLTSRLPRWPQASTATAPQIPPTDSRRFAKAVTMARTLNTSVHGTSNPASECLFRDVSHEHIASIFGIESKRNMKPAETGTDCRIIKCLRDGRRRDRGSINSSINQHQYWRCGPRWLLCKEQRLLPRVHDSAREQQLAQIQAVVAFPLPIPRARHPAQLPGERALGRYQPVRCHSNTLHHSIKMCACAPYFNSTLRDV